jgi:hypothetical protein
LCLKVGDVIRWDDFPYARDGAVKARWFIYLGRTSILATPVFAFLCTTTTQHQHFEPGGDRSHHACKRFDIREFPQFERNCILDYDEDLHEIREDMIDKCRTNIEIKGRLNENTMRNIFKQFARPGVVAHVIMCDIYESFNRDGITGLKKPK